MVMKKASKTKSCEWVKLIVEWNRTEEEEKQEKQTTIKIYNNVPQKPNQS